MDMTGEGIKKKKMGLIYYIDASTFINFDVMMIMIVIMEVTY